MQVDDRPPSLGAGPIDMAISAGYDLNPQSTSRAGALLPLALVATPDLITGGPARETLPARIKRIGLVGRPSIRADTAEIWALPLRRNRSSTVLKLPASQRFAVNNRLVAREIALAGLSSALLIEHSVKDALSTGQLQLVDPRYTYGHVTVKIQIRDRYPTAAALSLRQFLEDQPEPPNS